MQDYQIQDFQNYLQHMGLDFASTCFHNDMPSDRTATALISHEALVKWCTRYFSFQHIAKLHMDVFTGVYLANLEQYQQQESIPGSLEWRLQETQWETQWDDSQWD